MRQLINVRDVSQFRRFLRLCAGRVGQLVNLSALGNDCGVSHNTAREWLSVLEASYIMHRLVPHHRNLNKRLVKTPKLHFTDPGLATYLLGIETPQQLVTHPARGALFETWVVSELLKYRYHKAEPSNLYFWRDRTGHEIDIVVDKAGRLIPIEVKAGQTVTSDYFRGMMQWLQIAGDAAGQPWLIYAGDTPQTRQGVKVIPWRQISELSE